MKRYAEMHVLYSYLGVWIVKDSLMSEEVEEVNPVLVKGQDVFATVQRLALSSHLHPTQSINQLITAQIS
jgi:hypothetical protein